MTVGGKMGSLAIRYAHVSLYTNSSVEDYRDTFDERAMKEARAADQREPATDKAYRAILQGHENIRYQISEMRRALYDMGAGMTPRGQAHIEGLLKIGFKWHDPRPNVSLVEAQKRLLSCIKDMRGLWAALKSAEDKENGK